MSEHLIAIAVGPVQDFIISARRTRDLWYGSELLSQISKATARAIASDTGALIFPHQDAVDNPNLKVGNVILARLPKDADPFKLVEVAKIAARKCWEDATKAAFNDAKDITNVDIWKSQIDDVIEFYAAWVPLHSQTDYPQARERVMRLLAGRKACRDFKPARGVPGRPKSSLDGARESVLICGKTREETRQIRRQVLLETSEEKSSLAQRLRLAVGEELDVVGLTKRAATKESFPSVMRVAADPWIRGIAGDNKQAAVELREISHLCEGRPFATGTGSYYKDGNRIFPYDGSVLFISQLEQLVRDAEGVERDGRGRQTAEGYSMGISVDDLEPIKEIRKKLIRICEGKSEDGLGYGIPIPYFAVIAADGDRMGAVISDIVEEKAHRKFSKELAQFAKEASMVVEKHYGCLVYSGGDDVLAFVPVDTCLECARKLHDEFAGLLKDYQDEHGTSPTLSVGVAVGHCQDPLEDILQYAREAETDAKNPDRDGLAIHFHTRSGPPIRLRGRWQDRIDELLLTWTDMHLTERIPDKAAFDLRDIALDYAGWPKNNGTDEAIRSDIVRMLDRKRAGGQPLLPEDFEQYINTALAVGQRDSAGPGALYEHFHPGIKHLADQWIIARRLAMSKKQAMGKEKK